MKRHGGGFFSYHVPHLLDAVVFPRSRKEILEVLRFADGRGVPIGPFGQGSSLEGHTIPVRGAISMDLNFFEFNRSEGSVEEDDAAREKLWEARHEAGLAIRELYAGKKPMSTDVCVPLSDLPAALGHAHDTIASRGLDGAILGHVGDGNYYAAFPLDLTDEKDLRMAEEVNAEIVDYALARGGTRPASTASAPSKRATSRRSMATRCRSCSE